MQIFVLDSNPIKAAQDHCDADIPKQLLQSCKLLSVAHHLCPHPCNYELIRKELYKNTINPNDACIVWMCESIYNYLWLLLFAGELYKQYYIRFNKNSSVRTVLHLCNIYLPQLPFDEKRRGTTPFRIVMPDEYKVKLCLPNEEHTVKMIIDSKGKLIQVNQSTNAADVIYDVVRSYRNYYKIKKRHNAKWHRVSQVPEWFEES